MNYQLTITENERRIITNALTKTQQTEITTNLLQRMKALAALEPTEKIEPLQHFHKKLFPDMSKEEFTVHICGTHRLTEEDLLDMGLIIVPCTCGLPDCPKWTINRTEEFSLETFQRKMQG